MGVEMWYWGPTSSFVFNSNLRPQSIFGEKSWKTAWSSRGVGETSTQSPCSVHFTYVQLEEVVRCYLSLYRLLSLVFIGMWRLASAVFLYVKRAAPSIHFLNCLSSSHRGVTGAFSLSQLSLGKMWGTPCTAHHSVAGQTQRHRWPHSHLGLFNLAWVSLDCERRLQNPCRHKSTQLAGEFEPRTLLFVNKQCFHCPTVVSSLWHAAKMDYWLPDKQAAACQTVQSCTGDCAVSIPPFLLTMPHIEIIWFYSGWMGRRSTKH